MKTRHKRLAIAAGVLCAIAAAAALVMNAFQSNLVFFFSPSQVAAKEAPTGRTFRLGGLVEAGSVKRDGVVVNFVVTDTAKTVPVRYQGILPDLFKEGKGVVARAALCLSVAGAGDDGVCVPCDGVCPERFLGPQRGDELEFSASPGLSHRRVLGQP
jgi:cytochrome c-type biogenesis protein CcmE